MITTVNLFSTKGELLGICKAASEVLGYWITFIPDFGVPLVEEKWERTTQRVDENDDDRVVVVLTPGKPNLENVRQHHDFLGVNHFPSIVSFVFGKADEKVVFASSVIAYIGDQAKDKAAIAKIVRGIRAKTKTGFWIFSMDDSRREFRKDIYRYTDGAKHLQDAGARVSTYRGDPIYILGEDCPDPYSKALVVVRKK